MVYHRQRPRGWRGHQACGHCSVSSRPSVGHSKKQKPQTDRPSTPQFLDWKPCPVFPQATGNQTFQSKLTQCPSREGVEDPCNAEMEGWGPLPPCDFSRRAPPCACVHVRAHAGSCVTAGVCAPVGYTRPPSSCLRRPWGQTSCPW